jgi:regulator of replication initiation timing
MDKDKLCDERHENIEKNISEMRSDISGIKEDVSELQKSDAVHTTQIDNLCHRLGSLTTAIWAFIIVVIGGYITFFFTMQGSLFQAAQH